MSSVETFEYHLVARDDASAPIKKASDLAGTAAGNSQRFAVSLANVNEGMKNMAGRLGPAAAAISSVSGALGAAGGSAGKFVGMAGQVAAAFGAGGPFAAALVAGTIALDVFEGHLKKVEVAREAAFERNFDKQYGNLLKITKQTQAYNDVLRELNVELRYAGVGPAENLLRSEEMVRLRAEANRLANKAESPMDVGSWEDRERWRAQARALEVQADKLQAIVVKNLEIKRVIEEGEEAERRRVEAVEAYRRGTAEILAGPTGDIFGPESFANTDADVEAAKAQARLDARTEREMEAERAARERQEAADKDAADQRVKLEKSVEDLITKYHDEAVAHRAETSKKAAEEAAAYDKAFWQNYKDLGAGAFGALIDAGMSYNKMRIEGEKYAGEKATATFLETTGNQLVALGTRQMFEGGGMTLVGDPRGPALLGLGAAAVAVGGAMGGGGASWNASISAREEHDKTKAEKDKAARERGPRSLGGPTATAGAGTNVTIIYGGISGPTAEHGIHAWSKAAFESGSRFGLADEVQR